MAQLQLFSSGVAGIIIILSFIEMPSMIVISSLNNQYGCRSFCTSALVSGQLQSIHSGSMPKHLSPSVDILISSAVLQSGISKHEFMALMVIHMSEFLCLFVSRLSLDSQSVMNNCCLSL